MVPAPHDPAPLWFHKYTIPELITGALSWGHTHDYSARHAGKCINGSRKWPWRSQIGLFGKMLPAITGRVNGCFHKESSFLPSSTYPDEMCSRNFQKKVTGVAIFFCSIWKQNAKWYQLTRPRSKQCPEERGDLHGMGDGRNGSSGLAPRPPSRAGPVFLLSGQALGPYLLEHRLYPLEILGS